MARDFAKSFYNSKQWQSARDYVLLRDNYLCTECGAAATVVHHKTHLEPGNIDDPNISINPSNLVSLCDSCHYEAHRGEHAGGNQPAA